MQPLNPVLSNAVINEINSDRREHGFRARRFSRRNGLAAADVTGSRRTRAGRA